MVTRYLRFDRGGRPAYGRLIDEHTVQPLAGNLLGRHRAEGEPVPLASLRLLTPTPAGKVIAVGRNYPSHLGDRPAPALPGLFAKLPSCLIPHGAPIPLYADGRNLHYEGELVVVIGRRARAVSERDAPRHVLGVTIGNDVSERDWQREDLQWLRAKGADGFGPVGPFIATGLDYGDLELSTRVNGELRQRGRTRELIHTVSALLAFASRYVSLEPGDLLFTGTPGTTRAMSPGDMVEVAIEGVGVLRNPVVEVEPTT